MLLKITRKRSISHDPTKLSTPNLPPGPWKLPIIGHLHHLLIKGQDLPHHRLRNLANKYGPLMHLKLGEVSHIIASSPVTAKEAMRNNDVNFSQRSLGLPEADVFASMGITFCPHGDYWRQLRRICTNELLSPNRVKSFRSIREEEVSNLVRFLHSNQGSPINLSEKIFALTYSITSRAAFGKKCKEQEEFTEATKEGLKISAGFNISHVFPSQNWLRWMTGLGPKVEKNLKKTDGILQSIVDAYKEDKANNDVAEISLIDVLFNLQKKGDKEFSLDTANIKVIIMDIFMAGGETSSTVIEWAMLEMLKDPKIMEEAQAEVRRVFGSKGNVEETKDLDELKFLDSVIKETLRLHPPVVLIPRESKESCVIDGYEIPAKTKFIVNAWAIGRDPKYWTEPERFQPERFLESTNSVDFKGSDFQFIPIGAGRRMCPGIWFALADVKLPLGQLLFHFDWKLPNGISHENLDMSESFGLTVRRKGDLNLIPIPYDFN
ncbi:hypothetical protein TIFTF001_031309 [Ficus carica]|uniref:Cytochrome P450 n=1 Tax=Ficus carica TaxID=3494 RepID=A0AA88DUK8_FICCA|nr:hypothetical protein TIFTF001_031309 [Ficus carica]